MLFRDGDDTACKRACDRAKDGSQEMQGMLGRAFKASSVHPMRNTKQKKDDTQRGLPKVESHAVEVGAGWIRTGESSGKAAVRMSRTDPAFGLRMLTANRRRVARRSDEDVFAVIRNPVD